MKTMSKKNLRAGAQGAPTSSPDEAKSVSAAAYQQLKAHSDKLAQFLEVQGLTGIFKAFAAKREDPFTNLYLHSLNKAWREFLQEETAGCGGHGHRLLKKIEAAEILFPEDRKKIRCQKPV